MGDKAYLILEDGTVFEGKAFGAKKEAVGELVFTTSVIGYMETLTDPSYFGQVVLQTFPLVGNYGVIPSDKESGTPVLNAYVVRDWCQVPSNFRSDGELDTFLKTNNIPGLYDIDTRALTKIIREKGVMNCKLCYSLDNKEKDLEEIKAYEIKDAVKSVNTQSGEIDGKGEKTVVVWNFGMNHSIADSLAQCGLNVKVVPADTKAEEIASMNPDGVVLSDGPGDPAENTEIIEQVKIIMDKNIPVMGVGLGHQLMALACGAKTEKLHYGHRGSSQPAKFSKNGRVYITSQNHGYTVKSETLPDYCKVVFTNSNDGSCEGIEYEGKNAFSVQFHPSYADRCGTGFVFDMFKEMVG